MKILVCISHVPDTTAPIRFTEGDAQFDKQSVQYIIGPYEDYALARAVELRDSLPGATLTVINVGRADTEPTLRKALAIGANDAIRIDADPSDSLFVAQQLAHYIKDYNLILMGRETIDFSGGVVHVMAAQLLQMPCVSPIMKLDLVDANTARVVREIEDGKETLEVTLPAIFGCQEPIAEWKIPTMRGIMSAKAKPLQTLPPVAQSATVATLRFELPPPKKAVQLVEANQMARLVKLLKTEAKVIS